MTPEEYRAVAAEQRKILKEELDAKLNEKLGLGKQETFDAKLNQTLNAKLGLDRGDGFDNLDAKLNAKLGLDRGDGFDNLDAKLNNTIRTALDDKIFKSFSIAKNQSVDLMDWDERITNTERLVGTLVQSVPAAALRELKNHVHVVGVGTGDQDAAIGGTHTATWTYMTAGAAKLAVSCEHNPLKYKTEIGGAISDDKAFIELPQQLKGRVKAIGLLGTHKYGSAIRHPQNDIVIAVLTSFPRQVEALLPTPWEIHTDFERERKENLSPRSLMESNILGATLTDPVVGYGARKVYKTGVYDFHQTSEIAKGKEGGLMHCVNNDGEEEVLGVYIGATAVDQGYLGTICPLMSLDCFHFHDVVEPPTAGSTVRLVTDIGWASATKKSININTTPNGPASYPHRFLMKNNGQRIHGVFIDFHRNPEYTHLDKVLNLVHVNESGIGVDPLPGNFLNGA